MGDNIGIGTYSLPYSSGQSSVYLSLAEKYEIPNSPPEGNFIKPGPPQQQDFNAGLIALWVIVIIIALGIIIFCIWYGLYVYNISVEQDIITPDSYCTQLTSGLTDYSDLPNCPNQGLVKYDSSLYMLISPAQTSFVTACSSLCPSGFFDYETYVCSSSDQEANQRTANCIQATNPTGVCIGSAIPIGISNGTLYYALSGQLQSCYT